MDPFYCIVFMNHEIPSQMIAACNTDRTPEAHVTTVQYYNIGGTLLVAQLVEALRYKPEDRGFDS